MKLFLSFIVKETRHILRDKRTLLILFGLPVVMMLLYGFAISTDVKNVRTAVVMSSADHQTQRMVEALGANTYFDIMYKVGSAAEAEDLMRRQKVDIAIVFGPNFASKHSGIQVIADGIDPNMAQMYANYASQILTQEGTTLLSGMLSSDDSTQRSMATEEIISSRLFFNPQMLSAYNFVPGSMGVILMLICAMMTSISIVREKEYGTMEVLLVSPASPLMVIIAKAVPYLVITFIILNAILLISKYILFIPLAGSLWGIYLVSGIYIMLALSLGLLISTVARTQFVALLGSAMMLIMPSLMLSGMIYPIESMPEILQYLTAIMPPRFFISAMRKLLIMGVGIDKVIPEITVLAVMTIILLATALLTFGKTLEESRLQRLFN